MFELWEGGVMDSYLSDKLSDIKGVIVISTIFILINVMAHGWKLDKQHKNLEQKIDTLTELVEAK